MSALKKLTLSALILCVMVVGLGAFVRLSDAGLGCPDWPGCYGHMIGVPDEPHEMQRAELHFPHSPVEFAKAWKEMVHRYVAAMLGLLILAIAVQALRIRQERPLALSLVAVVCFQGALGMWTVTLLLKPAIVTAHLLGGMMTLGLLFTLYLRLSPLAARLKLPRFDAPLRALATVALIALLAQIALGGWVSSNYAAVACQGFPACNGSYAPPADYEHAFVINRALGQNAQGELLSFESLIAIHWVHRIGALILTTIILLLAWRLMRQHALWAGILVLLITTQVALGILNVLMHLPLSIAVAHNLGAAALMCALILLNVSLRPFHTIPHTSYT